MASIVYPLFKKHHGDGCAVTEKKHVIKRVYECLRADIVSLRNYLYISNLAKIFVTNITFLIQWVERFGDYLWVAKIFEIIYYLFNLSALITW